MIKTYVKKPVAIQAVQWDGYNGGAIRDWINSGDGKTYATIPQDGTLYIHTLETAKGNEFECTVGDFIIRGVKGEFYACKPDIFADSYEAAE